MWQPIETAPQVEGEPVLLWSPVPRQPALPPRRTIGYWRNETRQRGWGPDFDAGWYSHEYPDRDHFDYERIEPTHWMPLPEPPK